MLPNKYFLIQFTSDDTVKFHNYGEGLYWLHATSVTRAFSFKTLLRHYAKQVDMKLWCQGRRVSISFKAVGYKLHKLLRHFISLASAGIPISHLPTAFRLRFQPVGTIFVIVKS